jgi:hypothetical protein
VNAARVNFRQQSARRQPRVGDPDFAADQEIESRLVEPI